MDLATLTPTDDSVEIEVRHPATEQVLRSPAGDPVTISVYGADSAAFKAQQRAIVNRRLREKERKIATAEQREDEGIAVLAACVAGWKNVDFDGQPLEFSRQNARMLLTRLPWLREQLDEAIGDRANFLKASSTG